MKLKLLTLSMLMLPLLSWGQSSLLVGGSGSNQISIIDTKSDEIIWKHTLANGTECNSVIYTKDGNVAYSYKKGARLINKQEEVIFDYKTLKPGEELQSMTQIEGGFLLGLCGTPMRFVEIDHKGAVTKEFTCSSQVAKPHVQFRQVTKSQAGTYLVPQMFLKQLLEINDKGEILREIELPARPFFVMQCKDGQIIATCTDAGVVCKIDPDSYEVTTIIDTKKIEDPAQKIHYAAGVTELKGGNILFANWLGHRGDKTLSAMFECTPEGEIVKTYKNIYEEAGQIYLSCICPIYKKIK